MEKKAKGVKIVEPPSNGPREEVTYKVHKGENKLMKLKSKRYAKQNFAYYESGITNVEEKIIQPVIKKVIPRVNNFAYLDSNHNIYKEKGETVETDYEQPRAIYRTICRSPQMDTTPIIKYEMGSEKAIARPRNSKLMTKTMFSERSGDVVPLPATKITKVTMKTTTRSGTAN